MSSVLKRVVSGGQTGADQAGLEAARIKGIKTGGFAPKGYRTLKGSDYRLRDVYGLKETTVWNYSYRTGENVRHSDGTIRFASDFNSAGKDAL